MLFSVRKIENVNTLEAYLTLFVEWNNKRNKFPHNRIPFTICCRPNAANKNEGVN